jgi:acetyl esterase/lipase
MPLTMDPEIAAALQQLSGGAAPPPPPPVGDVASRRVQVEGLLAALDSLLPKVTDVASRELRTQSADGAPVRLRWFEKQGGARGPAVLYLHGGGMILGSVDTYALVIENLVSTTGVPMLAVDYRLAPEHPHPAPVEDCYAGLQYLAEHARSLGADPARLAVMGDSAGGGLAAATALVARDRQGPPLARQILIYPMLDDRNTRADPRLAPFVTWSHDDNVTGWGALLGARAGKEGVPHAAAPARATDFSNLAPAYLEVGQLDIFCNETILYALKLSQAGVPVELHVRPGAQHGFERLAPGSDVARRSTADRLRALRAL